ncbi:hypothetical protein ABW20_dc0108523 [Dactylellina cionopaga]|nr:hypothetical protein ABW20_dc0108523 [Dactylellina cionopaga]
MSTSKKDKSGKIVASEHHGLSRVFRNDYLCDIVLKYLDDQKTTWSLLNVNRTVRFFLLSDHFHYFRRLIFNRGCLPSYWVLPHPTQYDDIKEERYKKRMIETGQWPTRKYFDRFTDFAFEEFVVGKLLRAPYWFSPSMDGDYFDQMDHLGIHLTTLVLDGTAVTGRGLFGSVAMPKSSDIYRTTPGLLSFLSSNLQHLSLRYCPNVQHSDAAIYMLMPPAEHLQFARLRTLRLFGCGEAPTEGPFHNIPGYGSKNRIVQKADSILNIQILGILFPTRIPIEHHREYSVPLTISHLDGKRLKASQERLEELFQSGWLSAATLQQFPPPLTLPDYRTGNPVPGPFGGFLSTMHESLMLKSICLWANIKLDWTFCALKDRCASLIVENFSPAAIVNRRTGRIVSLGNTYGAIVGGKVRRQDYHHIENGVRPRIPVALSYMVPQKGGLFVPHTAEKSKPTQEKELGGEIDKRGRPVYLSLGGYIHGPDYEDPKGTGEVCDKITGLSGEGTHIHSAVGVGRRRESGGKACVNCGLWEYENYIHPTKSGKRAKNPGRYDVGEICEICVPFYTCGDCGEYVYLLPLPDAHSGVKGSGVLIISYDFVVSTARAV